MAPATDELKTSDAAFLALHQAGWSIGDTASVGPAGIAWLVYGTKGERSVTSHGATRAEAWRKAVVLAVEGEKERPRPWLAAATLLERSLAAAALGLTAGGFFVAPSSPRQSGAGRFSAGACRATWHWVNRARP